MRDFLSKLDKDKIRIAQNRNLIKMEDFLAFLTVEVEKSKNHLGHSTGWTQYNGDNGLVITGGILRSGEYLDHIKYGINLDNPYNNYVNPFHLFDIMTNEGKKFFLEYYADNIQKVLDEIEKKVAKAEAKLEEANQEKKEAKRIISLLNKTK